MVTVMHSFDARQFVTLLCLAICSILAIGCGHQPKPPAAIAREPGPTYYDGLIREAKAEADRLRAQLANERITIAKYRSEVQAAQHEASKLRDREAEFAQKLAATNSELSMVKNERDQLRRQNAELQAKTAGIPQVLELIAEIRTIQSSINGMVSNIQGLTTDLAAMKKDFQQSQARLGSAAVAKKSQTAASKPQSVPGSTDDAEDTVIVELGDTLWDLAQQHDLTVEELRAWNGLSGNLIFPGQKLQMRPPSGPASKRDSRATASSEPMPASQDNP